MFDYPEFYGKCNGCVHNWNEPEIGNVGCNSHDIWFDNGIEIVEIDELALEYQNGIKKCPHCCKRWFRRRSDNLETNICPECGKKIVLIAEVAITRTYTVDEEGGATKCIKSEKPIDGGFTCWNYICRHCEWESETYTP